MKSLHGRGAVEMETCGDTATATARLDYLSYGGVGDEGVWGGVHCGYPYVVNELFRRVKNRSGKKKEEGDTRGIFTLAPRAEVDITLFDFSKSGWRFFVLRRKSNAGSLPLPGERYQVPG